MNLLSNLQFTINAIFELYKTQGKRWYNFSMVFTIFSLLVCTLLTGLLLYGYYSTEQMIKGTAHVAPHVWDIMLSYDLMIYTQFMIILAFSLYGLFIYQQEQATEKITFGSFFKVIGRDTLWTYFLFSVGGIIVSKFISGLLNPSFYHPGSTLLDSMIGYSPLTEWFYSLLQFLLDQLPVVLAFMLIRRHLSKLGDHLSRKKAWTVFLTLLIVYFVINNFSADVVYFAGNYILKLIAIPFTEPLIPTVLMVVAYVFLIAVFAAGIAGSLIYPFTFGNNQLPVSRDQISEL